MISYMIIFVADKSKLLHSCYLKYTSRNIVVPLSIIRAWATNSVTIAVSRGCAIASESESVRALNRDFHGETHR